MSNIALFDMVSLPEGPISSVMLHFWKKLDAGMWRYDANRMDARRSQFDLGRVVAYI